MEEKVETIMAVAKGTVEGTANFMMEIGILRNKYEKGFNKLKERITLLESEIKKIKDKLNEILEVINDGK